MAVILNAPAVFRFTARACPERHLQAAGALGAKIEGARAEDAGDILAGRIIEFMQAMNLPRGLAEIGFRRSDLPGLVRGTLPQHRVTKISPRPADEADLMKLFERPSATGERVGTAASPSRSKLYRSLAGRKLAISFLESEIKASHTFGQSL